MATRLSEARNTTTQQTLTSYLNDPEARVRKQVALNHLTSPKSLALLAKDEDDYVRIAVARNPATPPHIVSELIRDPAPLVRTYVLNRLDATDEMLRAALNDEDAGVRGKAAYELRQREARTTQ